MATKKAAKKTTKAAERQQAVTISPPNIQHARFTIVGTSPYVQHKFSQKVKGEMMATQAAGSTAKKGRKREAKDFEGCFKAATHISEEGWYGIPVAALRNAMISACKLCGFHMSRGKLAVFVEADGLDKDEGTGLVRIDGGEPEMDLAHVRNATGVVDIRARPMWRRWEAQPVLRYDADQFTVDDVANLLLRAGMQVGIGEGRHDSKKSNGQGWGCFKLKG